MSASMIPGPSSIGAPRTIFVALTLLLIAACGLLAVVLLTQMRVAPTLGLIRHSR